MIIRLLYDFITDHCERIIALLICSTVIFLFIASRSLCEPDSISRYQKEVNPQVYLFEGQTPGEVMGERSIQYVIGEALQKTNIRKQVSMHVGRQSNRIFRLKTNELQEYFS